MANIMYVTEIDGRIIATVKIRLPEIEPGSIVTVGDTTNQRVNEFLQAYKSISDTPRLVTLMYDPDEKSLRVGYPFEQLHKL